MSNPFNNGSNALHGAQMTQGDAIALMMQQAFQTGTEKFVKQMCDRNPQAQQIYNMMMQSGDPNKFYFDMMAKRGMNKEQAIQFANNYGIKL